MKNFELKTAWGILRRKDAHILFHQHEYYELVYYCRGTGKGCVGGQEYAFSGGAFVLIPPCTEHEEYSFADAEILCVGFCTDEVLDFGRFKDPQGTVERIARAIIREASEQPPCYKEMILIKAEEMMLEMRRLESSGPQYSIRNFEYVINYISQNYHEKIMMKSMANQMHISYDYFQHRFKEIQGESPRQFLVRKRVEAAERLLSETELSCTEIACRCGFSNSAQFSAIFRRERGITPQQWRQKVRKVVMERK